MSRGIVKAELIHINPGIRRVLKDTLRIYRSACEYIGNVVYDNFEYISTIDTTMNKKKYIESLIHKTKDNPNPKYDFNDKFYKFPSYYRRSAISFALGEVQSYVTRLEQYKEAKETAKLSGKKFKDKEPALNLSGNACPCMYHGQMFIQENNKIYLKVYIRKDWNWISVAIPNRDLKDLEKKRKEAKKIDCPTLTFKYNKFYLNFPVEYNIVEFPKLELNNQIILSCDLGINHGAVISIMKSDGTILKRIFDPFQSERDRLDFILEKVRSVYSTSGKDQKKSSVYTKLDGIKSDYTRKLSRWIVDIAREYSVYGIVFEYLGKIKSKWKRKDKIHHWNKKKTQDLTKNIAFRYGIRTFFINPKNSSALEFDGSGLVS